MTATKKMTKDQMEAKMEAMMAMLEEMGGLTATELERLVQLYNQPNESLIITDEGGRKNSRMTVEL